MFSHILSPVTQAILLLCASFGQKRTSFPSPLTLKEYNSLAKWLQQQNMNPADLLQDQCQQNLDSTELDPERLKALLNRGMLLSIVVEKWTNQGLWILSRGDRLYPKLLKQRLRHNAPPLLYGIGNPNLLDQGGLAVVGSRDVAQEAMEYTAQVAQTCGQQGVGVVSGGARGVDQISMLEALAVGGKVVGVLADSLAKSAVSPKYRQGIRENRLTLISAFDPEAGFNVGNAMTRNKYIYALANYGLVISSSVNKGGTWNGAIEALKNISDVPVFVRNEGAIPEGNQVLIKRGGIPFPLRPWNISLIDLIEQELESKLTETTLKEPVQINIFSQIKPEIKVTEIKENIELIENTSLVTLKAKNIYELVSPFILKYLEKPLKKEELLIKISKELDIQKEQLKKWLEKCVQDKKIIKTTRPITYVINKQENIELEKINFDSNLSDYIYQKVLPFILEKLENATTDKTLAKSLELQLGQLRLWLKRGVQEGKIIRKENPITYINNNL